MQLDDINTQELKTYRQKLSLLIGNVLMQITLTAHPERDSKQSDVVISFKSLYQIIHYIDRVLQQWSKGWPGQYCEYDFFNFFLNYMECKFSRNRCNQLRFMTGLWECSHRQGSVVLNDLYAFKNLRENNNQSNILEMIDEILLVVAFQGMLFCYIYGISQHTCFLLDVQHSSKSRFGEHKQILSELLRNQYNITRSQDLKMVQLAEITYNKIQNQLVRASLIMDLLHKYIRNLDDVYKIEKIQINLVDANSLLDKIVWFVYKSYTEQPYKLKQVRQQHQELQYTNVTFKSWANDQDIHKKNNDYQNKMVQSQILNMKQDPLKKDGHFLGQQKYESGHQRHESQSSFFGKLANSQIISSSTIKPLELIKSVRLNKLLDTSTMIKKVDPQQQKSFVRADEFIEEAGYREAPQMAKRGKVQHSNDQSSNNGEKIILSKSQIVSLLDTVKQEIRDDLEKEFHTKLEEQKKQFKPNEKDQLQQAIVEEYMDQVKFQKYQNYMQELLSHYYNHDQLKYKQLLEEYHSRLQSQAINGITELHKKEMIKLISLTKEKVLQQNQQLDIALFNQKRVLEKMNKQKADHLKDVQGQSKKVMPNKQEYQFSKLYDVNPYQFKDENEMGNLNSEQVAYKKYDLVYPYAEEKNIQQVFEWWNFDYVELKQQMKQEEPKVSQNIIEAPPKTPSQSRINTIIKGRDDRKSGFGDSDLDLFSNDGSSHVSEPPNKILTTKTDKIIPSSVADKTRKRMQSNDLAQEDKESNQKSQKTIVTQQNMNEKSILQNNSIQLLEKSMQQNRLNEQSQINESQTHKNTEAQNKLVKNNQDQIDVK